MNSATFRYYGDLNDFLPLHKRQIPFPQSTYDGNQTVKHLIEAHGIPHTEVALILVQGEAVRFDHLVQPGDHISVYPPFTTLEPGFDTLLRPPLPQPARFLLDNHLGRLARYLRLLGFDTLYFHN
ncbi:MAG: Mut7-C RNAse domain-containing protein, partial [Candidatus Promineifilaceae bacterium]